MGVTPRRSSYSFPPKGSKDVIYSLSITTPANTGQGSALRTPLKVTRGLIWRIEIDYPPGCCGLCHCIILDGSYHMFPATPGESLSADGAVIGFDDLYYKAAAPFELTVVTWNDDETYDHTLNVRIGLASNEAFISRYLPGVTLKQLQYVLPGIEKEQEALRVAQLNQIASEIGGEENGIGA